MAHDYTPQKDGAIVAIRIYFEGDRQPTAELLPAFGGSYTIDWCCPDERKPFLPGINGYTFIYDERERVPFEKFRRPKL